MGQLIKVKLEKNQFVATEKSYVVALHLVEIGIPKKETLILRKARATSDNEALGMVIKCFRRDEKNYQGYMIANVATETIGD